MTKKQFRKQAEALLRIPSNKEFAEIWAVDFDGTLCSNAFPRIGTANEAMIRKIRNAQANGIAIILWTCRTGVQLNDAITWCAQNGIVFDAVNENLPSIKQKFGCDPRKIFANKYIDDKSEQVEN